MTEEARTRRRHDASGRSTGKFADGRFAKRNAPPPKTGFVWLTVEMLESFAWRAMSRNARLVVDRVCIEHMAHAGAHNGTLPVTFDDFERFGIRRASIVSAISEALVMGFVEMPSKGNRGWGEFKGRPSLFRLAWLPTASGEKATSGWQKFATRKDAEAAARKTREEAAARQARRDTPKADAAPKLQAAE